MSEVPSERQIKWVDGPHFIHQTRVGSYNLFASADIPPSPPPVATCRSPRGQGRCSCGMYTLRWMPRRP